MRTVVCALLAAGMLLGLAAPPSPAASHRAKGCHGQAATNLFLEHGISGVRARRVPCRRAVRTLRRWARAGMPGAGPAGWQCRSAQLNPDARRVRCTRRAARLRFDVGEAGPAGR